VSGGSPIPGAPSRRGHSGYRLPDIDGFTVLKRLKELNDDVKVIMITAYHDEHTIKRAMDLGAFAYVKKPIDLSDLESVIGRSLAHVPNHGSRQGDVRPLSSVVKS